MCQRGPRGPAEDRKFRKQPHAKAWGEATGDTGATLATLATSRWESGDQRAEREKQVTSQTVGSRTGCLLENRAW